MFHRGQRTDRCFGYFVCPKCKHKWSSGHSWPNMGQECLNCRINVYPYEQRPLEEKLIELDNSTIPHQVLLCEMCKKLGRDCSK